MAAGNPDRSSEAPERSSEAPDETFKVTDRRCGTDEPERSRERATEDTGARQGAERVSS